MPEPFDLAQLRPLASRAAFDAMRRLRMRLDEHRVEDLVSYLVVVGLRAHRKFDPSFGQSESTYLYRRMRPRVVDWIREELGDARQPDGGRAAWRRNLLVLDLIDADTIGAPSTDERSDEEVEAEWSQAIERLGERLSDEARETLEMIGPRLVDGLTQREIANDLGVKLPTVSGLLRTLREELELAAADSR